MTPLRPVSALPAAGAYDPAPPSVPVPPGTGRLTLSCTYALSTAMGATGAGFTRLRPEWKVREAWVPDPAVLSSSVVSGYQRNVLGGAEHSLPATVAPALGVDFAVPLTVPDGASDFRCAAAEIGDADHPGSLATFVAFGRR